MVRFESQAHLVGLDGLENSALVPQQDPQVVEGLGVARIGASCCLAACQRSFQEPQLGPDHPQVTQDLREERVELQGTLVVVDGALEVPCAMGHTRCVFGEGVSCCLLVCDGRYFVLPFSLRMLCSTQALKSSFKTKQQLHPTTGCNPSNTAIKQKTFRATRPCVLKMTPRLLCAAAAPAPFPSRPRLAADVPTLSPCGQLPEG